MKDETIICGTVYLYLVLLLDASMQLGCDPVTQCAGLRPKSSSGCCPLQAGDECDISHRITCDSDLGYKCTSGICRGQYNVTSEWTGVTSINLTWSPFLPDESHNTYTVLYSTELHQDPLMFNSHSARNQTSFILQGLTPSTWYYVQVGIWTGSMYNNLSEIVLAQTKAMDHCLYNGHRVPIGEQLVVDCEESCYCAPTGRFLCVPVCSKLHPDTPVCSDTVTHVECCDHVHRCSHDSCSYLGEPVQHEYSWVIDCAENCTCYDGSVTCIPLCGIVTIPDNCTHPVLTKSFEGCCDSLECQVREDTCQYKNTFYMVDTWFHGSECEICTCTSSREVACVDLHICGATTTLPDTSVACPVPTVIDNRCCEQIVCDRQTDTDDIFSTYSITKYSVSSILVRFQFISTKDEHAAIQMTLFFANDGSTGDVTAWISNFSVAFNNIIDTTNVTLELRDFGKPFVLYKINNNYLCVIPKLTLNTFYFIKLQIDFDKNKKVITEYRADTRAIKLPGLQLDAPYHLTSRVDSVSITVTSISSNRAFISWTLPEPLLHNISSFLIKYKPFSASQWQFTERLIFSDRNFLLQCLFHSKWYEAQLEAHPGGRRLASTFFNTSSIKEFSTEKFFPSIRNISIQTSSVAISWQGIPLGVAADVFNIEVLWTCGTDGDTPLKACVAAKQDSYILQELASGTMYAVWLGINMKDGTTVFTNRIHFVTLHQYNAEHSGTRRSIVVAVTVACVSFVAMVIAVAIVIYLLKFKRRASYDEHTSFENRIFQIYSNKEDQDL